MAYMYVLYTEFKIPNRPRMQKYVWKAAVMKSGVRRFNTMSNCIRV